MAAAGYSGTPLHRKLGVDASSRVLLVNPFEDFRSLAEWPEGCRIDLDANGEYEVIVVFVRGVDEVERSFRELIDHLVNRGGLWFSWPKKSSSLAAPGLTEDAIRELGLSHGLVDNKVCAIDKDWSGLRFVRRKK